MSLLETSSSTWSLEDILDTQIESILEDIYVEKSLLRRSATPTARIRRYSLQSPGARGMSLLETSS